MERMLATLSCVILTTTTLSAAPQQGGTTSNDWHGPPVLVDPLEGNHDCANARDLVAGDYGGLVVTASQPDYYRLRVDPHDEVYLNIAVLDTAHDFRVEVLDGCAPVPGTLQIIHYDDVSVTIQNSTDEACERVVRLFRDVGTIANYDPAVFDLTVAPIEDVPYPEVCQGGSGGETCPCANNATEPGGCTHSGGYGARLAVSGSQLRQLGELNVVARGLPAGAPAVLLSAKLDGGDPALQFGDGILCAGGGGVVRHAARVANAAGCATWNGDVEVGAGRDPGQRLALQVWYRDRVLSPCASRTNFTQGVELRVLAQ